MLGALFFRYFELAADEEGDGSVSEQVISRGDLRCDGKLLMILAIYGTQGTLPGAPPVCQVNSPSRRKMISLTVS